MATDCTEEVLEKVTIDLLQMACTAFWLSLGSLVGSKEWLECSDILTLPSSHGSYMHISPDGQPTFISPCQSVRNSAYETPSAREVTALFDLLSAMPQSSPPRVSHGK